MFNSIRSLQSPPSYKSVAAPKMYGVAFKGESVIDVPIKRQLVDQRVKFDATHAIDLANNGVKYSRVSISPSIEEIHEAVNIVRSIEYDALVRAAAQEPAQQTLQESAQQTLQESSQQTSQVSAE